jgi:hypothetical protein
MLAIGAVILVTLILLPLRVAVIAAVAIPVTVCTTLGVLNGIGVQLHQGLPGGEVECGRAHAAAPDASLSITLRQ